MATRSEIARTRPLRPSVSRHRGARFAVPGPAFDPGPRPSGPPPCGPPQPSRHRSRMDGALVLCDLRIPDGGQIRPRKVTFGPRLFPSYPAECPSKATQRCQARNMRGRSSTTRLHGGHGSGLLLRVPTDPRVLPPHPPSARPTTSPRLVRNRLGQHTSQHALVTWNLPRHRDLRRFRRTGRTRLARFPGHPLTPAQAGGSMPEATAREHPGSNTPVVDPPGSDRRP